MREIKFRAWDGKTVDYYPSHEPGDLAVTMINDFFDDSDYVFMQYTGLKDKNGKEIYEGDIVKMWAGNWMGVDKWLINPVVFHQGSAGPCKGENVMEWRMGDLHNLWNGSGVEIIGNIYENPELLEK